MIQIALLIPIKFGLPHRPDINAIPTDFLLVQLVASTVSQSSLAVRRFSRQTISKPPPIMSKTPGNNVP